VIGRLRLKNSCDIDAVRPLLMFDFLKTIAYAFNYGTDLWWEFFSQSLIVIKD
jgi:hypothetical protein